MKFSKIFCREQFQEEANWFSPGFLWLTARTMRVGSCEEARDFPASLPILLTYVWLNVRFCKLFRTSWKVINNLDSHWKLKLQSFQWHRMAVSAESGPKWKVGTHRSSFWNLNRALILTFLLVIKIFSLCSSNKGINFALKSPHAFK